MEFTPTADIASSDDESYFVKFGKQVNLMNEFFDMFMVKALPAITESLTRELEK